MNLKTLSEMIKLQDQLIAQYKQMLQPGTPAYENSEQKDCITSMAKCIKNLLITLETP